MRLKLARYPDPGNSISTLYLLHIHAMTSGDDIPSAGPSLKRIEDAAISEMSFGSSIEMVRRYLPLLIKGSGELIRVEGRITNTEIAMNILENQLAGFATEKTMTMWTVVSIPAVVHAQSEMRANILFDFYIGSQKLSSGTYSFEVSGTYVKVSGRDGHSVIAPACMVPNPESRTLNGGKLMFSRYDNYFFLSEVRRAGYTTGLGLIRSHLEAQIAKSSGDRQRLAFAATR